MYKKQQIKEKLEEQDCYFDLITIANKLKELKIDPIYEDENSEEFFDDYAINKLCEILKSCSESKNEAIAAPAEVKTQYMDNGNSGAELKKITLDITNQTLAVLSESIAHKITSDIKEQIANTDILKSAVDAGAKKRDNEILAKQVDKLLEENKRLISKINNLQQENSKYRPIVGSVYMKMD